MPPPPCAWQPTQLYCSYSFSPSETAYALSSYRFEGGGVGMQFAPGSKPLPCTVLMVWSAGGGWRRVRLSREHATSNVAMPKAASTSAAWKLLRINWLGRPPGELKAVAELNIAKGFSESVLCGSQVLSPNHRPAWCFPCERPSRSQ